MIPSHSINTLPNPYLDTNRIKEANSFKENEGLNQEQKILIKTTSGKNKSTEEEYIVGKQLGKVYYICHQYFFFFIYLFIFLTHDLLSLPGHILSMF